MITLYESLYPNTSHGYKDIYKYFYDFGLSICRKNGVLCYITPNTFLRQPRYGDLRRVLLKVKIDKLLDLGEKIFEDAVVPVAICLIFNKKPQNGDFVDFIDLTQVITVNNAKEHLLNIKFINITQEIWNKTLNNIFVEEQQKINSNVINLDNILKFKDAGINYQRVNVGLAQKGRSDLSSRLLYEGNKENNTDVEYWKGEDINSFYINPTTNKFCRTNIELRENERVILNAEYFRLFPKLIWRQTAPYPICSIDYKGIWFGRSIQAGIIKEEYKDIISYEYLCGLLNSNYLRNIYEQYVREGGRVFPQVKLEKLKPLPIIIPTKEDRQKVEDLVNQIITQKSRLENTEELEIQINQVVDELYNN